MGAGSELRSYTFSHLSSPELLPVRDRFKDILFIFTFPGKIEIETLVMAIVLRMLLKGVTVAIKQYFNK